MSNEFANSNVIMTCLTYIQYKLNNFDVNDLLVCNSFGDISLISDGRHEMIV